LKDKPVKELILVEILKESMQKQIREAKDPYENNPTLVSKD